MKRLLYLILAVILACTAALYTGCGKDDGVTTAPPVPVDLVNGEGKAVYRIVRADKINVNAKDEVTAFKNDLESVTGTELDLVTDVLSEGESLDSVSGIYEILVGRTNRPESIEAVKGLTENDYVIRVTGNKIVIVGGSDLMTRRAMDAFLEIVGDENGSALKSNTDIKKTIERGKSLVALTNQSKWYVEVYDISTGVLDESSLVWSYKMPHSNIAGVKLRHSEKHGDVMLAVSGSRYGCMVSYPEGKVVWSTEAAASNPHSIELLPGGVVAIASSDGNEVRFFKTDEKTSRSPDAKMSLADAHGVLWDAEREVLWAVGRNVLTAYKVKINGDGTLTVSEESSLRAEIPTGSAHDLAPVYGDKNQLWITTGAHVYRYNKAERTFSISYDGNEIVDRSTVKGIGNFENGDIVYIFPDGQYQSWTSKSAYILKKDADSYERITSEDGDFYKIRVWEAKYQ